MGVFKSSQRSAGPIPSGQDLQTFDVTLRGLAVDQDLLYYARCWADELSLLTDGTCHVLIEYRARESHPKGPTIAVRVTDSVGGLCMRAETDDPDPFMAVRNAFEIAVERVKALLDVQPKAGA